MGKQDRRDARDGWREYGMSVQGITIGRKWGSGWRMREGDDGDVEKICEKICKWKI